MSSYRALREREEGGERVKRDGEAQGWMYRGHGDDLLITGPSAGSRSIASPPLARAAAMLAVVRG